MKTYSQLTINEKINQKQSDLNRLSVMGIIGFNIVERVLKTRFETLDIFLFNYVRTKNYFKTGGLINPLNKER